MIQNTDLAYAAGFFDGEGSISWQTTKRVSGKVYKLIRVDIGQVDRSFLEWCKEHFGGSITTRNANKHRSKHENYQWTLSGENACLFLDMIIPYLRQKRQHAINCVIEWRTRNNCAASYIEGDINGSPSEESTFN